MTSRLLVLAVSLFLGALVILPLLRLVSELFERVRLP